jgi:hypothetical protein
MISPFLLSLIDEGILYRFLDVILTPQHLIPANNVKIPDNYEKDSPLPHFGISGILPPTYR